MVLSDEKFWWVQLDEEASSRLDQSSFHVCADGMLSEIHADILSLHGGETLSVPSALWPRDLSNHRLRSRRIRHSPYIGLCRYGASQ